MQVRAGRVAGRADERRAAPRRRRTRRGRRRSARGARTSWSRRAGGRGRRGARSRRRSRRSHAPGARGGDRGPRRGGEVDPAVEPVAARAEASPTAAATGGGSAAASPAAGRRARHRRGSGDAVGGQARPRLEARERGREVRAARPSKGPRGSPRGRAGTAAPRRPSRACRPHPPGAEARRSAPAERRARRGAGDAIHREPALAWTCAPRRRRGAREAVDVPAYSPLRAQRDLKGGDAGIGRPSDGRRMVRATAVTTATAMFLRARTGRGGRRPVTDAPSRWPPSSGSPQPPAQPRRACHRPRHRGPDRLLGAGEDQPLARARDGGVEQLAREHPRGRVGQQDGGGVELRALALVDGHRVDAVDRGQARRAELDDARRGARRRRSRARSRWRRRRRCRRCRGAGRSRSR